MMGVVEKLVEKALNSSSLMLTLVKHIATLTAEVKNIKESLALVVKTVNVQQAVIEQLLQEKAAHNSSRGERSLSLDVQKFQKKEKPN